MIRLNKENVYLMEIVLKNGMIKLYIQEKSLIAYQMLAIYYTIHISHSNSFINAYNLYCYKNKYNVDSNAKSFYKIKLDKEYILNFWMNFIVKHFSILKLMLLQN